MQNCTYKKSYKKINLYKIKKKSQINHIYLFKI